MNKLLKFITCGSVDDGKSTLIGHLLYNAKLLYSDQAQALELDSKIYGKDNELNYSILLDGLVDEREAGITIDVAYRFFSTSKRSFICADTPGHEEYTRNMAVGASFADLAIILIDSTKGILDQTKRHLKICSLMGIKHFIFAVNKMDLINYSFDKYEKIEKDIYKLIDKIQHNSCQIIPLSALKGDNITTPSINMKWYMQDNLLSYLENIDVDSNPNEYGFTIPIQRVCRPDYTFRGYQGYIESGEIKVGDEVINLPSNTKANIKRIINSGKYINTCHKGQSVTLELDKEIDVSRGCVLVNSSTATSNHSFTAQLLWMDDIPLKEGQSYLIKLGTKKTYANIKSINYKCSINTDKKIHSDIIHKNELSICEITTSDEIVFDEFKRNPGLGCFILINRISHVTSACGTVIKEIANDNLTWYQMDITRNERALQKGQIPKTLWFTGLSGAGKSTLANYVEKHLFELGKHTMTLDGDNIRLRLNKDLGFNDIDRSENLRRVAEVSKLMNDAGLIVIASFITPYKKDRDNIKEIIGGNNFIEIYVSTPLNICKSRDCKGLYKRAKNGDIENFTGVSSAYEPPVNPNIEIDTSTSSIEECGEYIINKLILNSAGETVNRKR